MRGNAFRPHIYISELQAFWADCRAPPNSAKKRARSGYQVRCMPQRPLDDASSRLLQTLQDNPALPALLRDLQPAALARLVDRIGLNDAGEVMALAPTHKLLQALDEVAVEESATGRRGSLRRARAGRLAGGLERDRR